MIEVVHGQRPPNYEAIQKVFPMASGLGVIFAYGDKIYTMSQQQLPLHLVAHEAVHCARQLAYRHPHYGNGVEGWWKQYLVEIPFCREEEILAHRAEYEILAGGLSRQRRRRALIEVAKKLSAALYGPMICFEAAKDAILADEAVAA